MQAEAVVCRRHIDKAQLHAVDPVPMVHAQRASGMQALAATSRKSSAQRLAAGAERDRADARAVSGAKPHTHMRLSGILGIDEGVGGQHDDRLWITGAERTGTGNHRQHVAVGSRGSDGAIDQERIVLPCRLHRGGKS